MSRFYDNAARILEAAENLSDNGNQCLPSPGMVIWISPEGGIRMTADCAAQPLDDLQAQTGAQMIYRVTQQDSKLRLEGRAGFRTCLFEAAEPDGAARALLGAGASQGCYRLEASLPKQNRRPLLLADAGYRSAETGQLVRTTA